MNYSLFLLLSYLICIDLINVIRADNENDLIDLLSNLIKNDKSNHYDNLHRKERLTQNSINEYTNFGMYLNSPDRDISHKYENKLYNSFYQDSKKAKNTPNYNVIHLRFKIKPEQHLTIAQGLIQNDQGENLKYFKLMPQEIPELLRNLLAAIQTTNKPKSSNHKIDLELQSFINEKKRAVSLENDPSLANLEKRSFMSKMFKKKKHEKNSTSPNVHSKSTNKTFV